MASLPQFFFPTSSFRNWPETGGEDVCRSTPYDDIPWGSSKARIRVGPASSSRIGSEEVAGEGTFRSGPKKAGRTKTRFAPRTYFVEDSERQIHGKARGLGRPLLSGLLASALQTRAGADADPPHLRKWFRSILKTNSRELAGTWEDDGGAAEHRSIRELRSIYASYRLDQVAHFITLVGKEEFHSSVERILEGESFDFGAKDRLQFAMMVVEFIESRLPLPPFEVWVEDYLAHPEEYRLYTHTLHREGRLP